MQFAVPVEEEVKIGGVESAQPLSSPAKGAAKYKKSPELLANRGTLEVTPISAPQAGAAKSALLASSVIKGKVLDEAGEGIPGVMIQDYRNQVVITDSVGNFSIHASEGDSLNLASVGYKRKDLLVGKDNFNAIVLEEDSKSLSEVVGLGYGVQRKRSVAGANVEKKEKEVPVPAQGLDAYTAYLKEKTRLTSQKGEVSVSFTVSAGGSLSQFQAKGKKSLRDLAIQIIKEGPPWAPFKINGIGVERKVEVVVKFGE